MSSGLSVRTGWSVHSREREAVDELRETLGDPAGGLVLLYVWPDYDMDALAAAVRERFREATVAGCTTAGHVLDGHGYVTGGITGLALASRQLQASRLDIPDVGCFGAREAARLGERVREARDAAGPGPRGGAFGLLLIDGMCGREEFVTSALDEAMGGLPIVGGSAGDAERFEHTFVWNGERFASNAASLVLVRTRLPFRTFSTHHFDVRHERLVVTDADAPRRIVRTINGVPAAEAYAHAIGLVGSELTASDWAHRPLVVKSGDQLFVRSIREVLDDGSLQLYCAIDGGMVLRIGRPRDLVVNLNTALSAVRHDVPNVRAVLGFDCILRRRNLVSTDRLDEAGRSLAGSGMFAFSTYGEQVGGIHYNQTLTGVAIGEG